MRVRRRIRSPLQRGRDGVSEEDGEDFVYARVGLCFVECFAEVRNVQKGGKWKKVSM